MTLEKEIGFKMDQPSTEPKYYDFFADAEKLVPEKGVDLPQSQKTVCTDPEILPIWKLIKRDPEVREALEDVWSPFDSPDCKDLFELKYMDLDHDGRAEILVRGGGVALCGAVGNCDFWVIKRERKRLRLLLHANDYIDATEMGKQVLKSRTNGYSDLLLKGHFSGAETSYSTYKYNGRKYVERKCQYRVPNDDDQQNGSEDPTWHFITCEAFIKG